MKTGTKELVKDLVNVLCAVMLVPVLALVIYSVLDRIFQDPCYVYVPNVSAEWVYTQYPMKECSFCTSEVNLNRHHIISQLAAPDLANEPTNIIVLCRSCHQVLGHKNNWKKFNPSVREICDRYGGPPVDSRLWREKNGK